MALHALQGYPAGGGDRLFDWEEDIDKKREKKINPEQESAILYHLFTQWRDQGITGYYVPDFGTREKKSGCFR